MRKVLGMLVALLAVVFLAAGCGSSGSSSSESTSAENTSASESSSSGESADPVVAEAKAAVEKMTSAPTTWSGPTTGPAAVEGKKIVYISCESANEICVRVGKSIEEAGKTLGWSVTTIDGKGTTAGWLEAWTQALALNPDGVIAFTDAQEMQVPIKKANARGIPVIGVLAAPQPGPDKELGLFTNISQDPASIGTAEAQYAIAKSNGTAKAVVMYASQYAIATVKGEAMKAEMERCSGCELAEYKNIDPTSIQAQGGPLVTGWVQKFGTPLWVLSPGDALLSFMTPALRSAGVGGSEVQMVGADGNASAYELIREGQYQVATFPQPTGELGYQAADEMNRALAGEEATDYSPELFLVEAENVDLYGGKENRFEPENDYRGHYEEIWSGKG
ncbi:MAG TPA: substrate-binding domain-containing protein [Solirubrobacterales bacterium]|nr:substrate-binding domain-containing protein [Solirubrobacterales bacterium]